MATLLHSILNHNKRSIEYVYPDVSVANAVEMMVDANIGALVVSDEENIIGILSERDVVRSLVAKGRSPNDTKVSDVLCSKITILSPNDTVEKAMAMITKTKRHHLLVKEDETLLGVISIGDLLFYLLEEKDKTIDQLQDYIHTN